MQQFKDAHGKDKVVPGMEPTGHYWFNLGKFLQDNEIKPVLVNPHHGLEPKLGQGTLLIDAYRTRSRLFINISDDGVGIPTDRLTEINHILSNSDQIILSKRNGFSIGLYNVNTRIRLLFGFEYGLSIVSAKDIGTKVQISLPILT